MKREIANYVETAIKAAQLTGTPQQIELAKKIATECLESWFQIRLIDNAILKEIEFRLDDLGMTGNGQCEMEIEADGIGPDGTDTHAVFRGSVVVADFKHYKADKWGIYDCVVVPESTEFIIKYSGRITYTNENGCWSRNFIGENFINY